MSEWSRFALEAAKKAIKPTEKHERSQYVQRVAKQAIRKADRREQVHNQIRAARRERLWAEYDVATTLCLNCNGIGHLRGRCVERGIIDCSPLLCS